MPKRIVFWGDSITDSLRDIPHENGNRGNVILHGCGYVRLIEAALGFEYPLQYEVWNRGISGSRIVDLYARIKKDVINLKPDVVSILIGINDIGHEYAAQNGVEAEKYLRVYDRIVQEIKTALPNVKIVIMEPFVLPGFNTVSTEQCPGRWEFFTKEILLRQEAAKAIADQYGLLFLPLHAAFTEANSKGQREDYWLGDGIHPFSAGHELIKRRWLELFERYIHEKD